MNAALSKRIERALADALDEPVHITSTATLGGGCINEAARIDTNRGPYFLKHNARGGALFSTEAAGLEAMRASGTSLAIPSVIAFADPAPGAPGFLVASFLEPGPRGPDFDEALGRGLAELHGTTRPAFGFDIDTYCGETVQPNPDTPRWIDFYRDHRLGHQLALGRSRGLYDGAATASFERLLDRLDTLLDEPAAPALIHGDLWSGNLHADGHRPALVDPAAYFGHPEAELGMMTLFGGFSRRVFDAYAEASMASPDWRARNPLYQLYHVMNHATLFGGSYVAQAVELAARYA